MNKKLIKLILVIIFISLSITGCNNEDEPAAPYLGNRSMENIQVQQGSYKPNITWIGGNASVVGVNRGPRAALDSTLIWLIHTTGNNIPFKIQYGVLPAGAEDITEAYGGTKADSLNEDFTYSYWVVKEDVWNQISNQSGKILQVDSTITSITVDADTLLLPVSGAVNKAQAIDVWINILNVQTFGRLADLSVIQTDNSNNPIITWIIKEQGVVDPNVSAIGLVEGQQYQEVNAKWSAWSMVDVDGQPVYGRHNIITAPVVVGQEIPGTRVFNEYTLGELERGKDYLVWIANDIWNQSTRSRAASGYAWVTFRTGD